LTALAGVVLLCANTWRTLVFFSTRATTFEVDDSTRDVAIPEWLQSADHALRRLAFEPLGTFVETRRLGPSRTVFGYVHPAQSTFALVFNTTNTSSLLSLFGPLEPRLEREGPGCRVTFLTPAVGGGFLLSSNHRRPGAEVPGQHLCAGLAHAPIDRLFRAHLRRFAELPPAQLHPATLDALVTHVHRWATSFGRTEQRRLHAVGQLWTLGGLGMVAFSVVATLRSTT
jgi:hypothetical protein